LAGAAAYVILFGYLIQHHFTENIRAILHGSHTGRTTQLSFDPVRGIQSDLPLIAASGLTFLEMDHYAGSNTTSRLYYLTDREFAINIAHATIFGGFANLKRYFPIRANVQPYREFTAKHSHFLVLGTPWYPEDWLLPHLLDIHAKLIYLGSYSSIYKDGQLYEVTLPDVDVALQKANSHP
jgi:hypothetical protein